jgi:hypothetical protein
MQGAEEGNLSPACALGAAGRSTSVDSRDVGSGLDDGDDTVQIICRQIICRQICLCYSTHMFVLYQMHAEVL